MLETNKKGKELRNNMREIITLKWEKGNLLLLDQTLLPNTVTYATCKTLEDVYQAIQTMIVRGAPAIGVSAGYGMVRLPMPLMERTRLRLWIFTGSRENT